MRFGVDVSEFQTVDYSKAVKSGNVQFAIIRIGYGRMDNQKDASFETHYAGFRAQGIPVGVYHYSYASDAAGARAEADTTLKWLNKRSLELPIFLDMEESSVYYTGAENCKKIADAYCEVIKKAGYRAGVYASTNWWRGVLKKEDYDYVWCADWGSKQPECDIWQFGGGSANYMTDRHVPGIGICDQNYMVRNIINSSAPPSGDKQTDKKPEKKEKTCVVTLTYLQNGSQGTEVKSLQILLNGYGCDCGKADGIFGAKTEAAVKKFQAGKKVSVDGIVGPVTWGKLLRG